MKNYFDYCMHYSCLGYEVSLINIFGKEGISMKKKYSYPAKRSLYCQQIVDHISLLDIHRLHSMLDFMYNNIQEQEESGKYFEPLDN